MVEMYHVPKNEMPRIDSIWAFVSVDPADGNEGVCAATIGGVTLPLIAADEKRLAILTPIAENIALRTGLMVQLVRFHQREVIKQFDGAEMQTVAEINEQCARQDRDMRKDDSNG